MKVIASEVTRWTIIDGPDRFQFAGAYFDEHPVTMELAEGECYGALPGTREVFEAVTSIRSAVPPGGGLRNDWVIWGQFHPVNETHWTKFRGTYNLETKKGVIVRMSQKQYDKLDADAR